MKVLAVIAAALMITGCSSVKSLEALEQEAAISGDWSKVEARERLIAKRKAKEGLSCPAGYISYCESFAGEERCGCLTRQGMRNVLAGR